MSEFPFKQSRTLVYFKRKSKSCIWLEATEKWLLEWEHVCNLNYRCCCWSSIGNHMELMNQRKKKTLLLINENRLQNMQPHFSLGLFIFFSRKVLGVEKVTALNILQWAWLYVTLNSKSVSESYLACTRTVFVKVKRKEFSRHTFPFQHQQTVLNALGHLFM